MSKAVNKPDAFEQAMNIFAHAFCAKLKRGEDAHMIAISLSAQRARKWTLTRDPVVLALRDSLREMIDAVDGDLHGGKCERAVNALRAYELERKGEK